MFKKHKRLFLGFFLICFSHFGWSQDSLRLPFTKFLQLEYIGDTLIVDTALIVSQSVKIFDGLGAQVPPNLYKINAKSIFLAKGIVQPVLLSYEYLPLPSPIIFRRFDYEDKRQYDGSLGSPFYDPLAPNKTNDIETGLKYSGTFSRGLSFGNNQNLVLNSAFNLAISGKLTDGIEVTGALNDDNLPLQPEGNTQKLSDFDKVYLEIKRKDQKLIAGDYEIQYKKGHFMRYQKKLQGASISFPLNIKDSFALHNAFSYALSRGRYTRYILNTIEGNQGPYKLVGAKGEVFIIILAGTERVYWDGALLIRGSDQDYIIDYNIGEISFTAKKLITKDSRITVEYDYTDQNYTRSLITASSEITRPNWQFGLNLYNDKDHKNTATLFTLDSATIGKIKLAGDQVEGAGISSIKTYGDGFDINRILYHKFDTLGTTILKIATKSDTSLFTATFTDIGEGKGNYIRSKYAYNGRAYVWTPPDPITGNPTGRYEPIAFVPAPGQVLQMAAYGRYDFKKAGQLSGEFSLTKKDKNLFSTLNDADNIGLGGYLDHTFQKMLGKYHIQSLLKVEWVDAFFSPINQYRSIEFNRQWNFYKKDPKSELIQSAAFTIKKDKLGSLMYSISSLSVPNLYKGYEHKILLNTTWKRFDFYTNTILQSTQTDTSNGRFFRPNISLEWAANAQKTHTISLHSESDFNRYQINGVDSLDPISLRRDQLKLSYAWNVPDKKQVSFFVKNIIDYDRTDAFKSLTYNAVDFGLEGFVQFNKQHKLNWTGTIRRLEDLVASKKSSTILGRVTHQLTLLKNSFRFFTNAEIRTGLEPTVEFAFVKVRPGDGLYLWNDFNNDSIPQINEFEISPFKDKAEYVKISSVSNQYTETRQLSFGHSFRLEPQSIWKNGTGWKKSLSKFSNFLNISTSVKIPKLEDIYRLLPFSQQFDRDQILAGQEIVRNTLYYNRGHSVYDLFFTIANSKQKSLLSYGTELRSVDDYILGGRYNANSYISLKTEIKLSTKANTSQYFMNRSYHIDYKEIKPEIEWQAKQQWRVESALLFIEGKNKNSFGGESLKKMEFLCNLTLQSVLKSSIRGNLRYSLIQYNGEPNTPIEFVMLEGLKSGNNWLWGFVVDRRISDSVTMSIGYDGRKTGDNSKIIHIGKAQMRANF